MKKTKRAIILTIYLDFFVIFSFAEEIHIFQGSTELISNFLFLFLFNNNNN